MIHLEKNLARLWPIGLMNVDLYLKFLFKVSVLLLKLTEVCI